MSEVTLEELQKTFPARAKTLTQEAVDIINESTNDPEFQGESLLDAANTYQYVLQGKKASIIEYLNALKFCSYLITYEDSSTKAYIRVFSNRDFVKNRMDLPTESNEYKALVSAASRYRQSKLVVEILTGS